MNAAAATTMYTIEAVRLTKKKGSVKANAHILFLGGKLRVTFKVVNGPNGLFLAPPAALYRGSNGRSSYVPYAKVLDKELLAALQRDVLAEYTRIVNEQGYGPPKPTERPEPKPDRVKELLREASEHVTAETAASVFSKLVEMLEAPNATGREKRSAARALVRMLQLRGKPIDLEVSGQTEKAATCRMDAAESVT